MDHDGKRVPGQAICHHAKLGNGRRGKHMLGTWTLSLAIFDLANRTITVSKAIPCRRRFKTFTFQPNPHYDVANEARKTQIRRNRRRAKQLGPYDEELDLGNWADRREGVEIDNDEDAAFSDHAGSGDSAVAFDDDTEMDVDEDRSVPRLDLWTEEEQTNFAIQKSLEDPDQKSRSSTVCENNSLDELEKFRGKRRRKLEKARKKAEKAAQQRAQGHGGGTDQEDKSSLFGSDDIQEENDPSFDSRNAETFAGSDDSAEDLALSDTELKQQEERELRSLLGFTDNDDDVVMQMMMMESLQALVRDEEQKASPEMKEPDSAVDVTTSPSIPSPAVLAAAVMAPGDSA